MKIINALCVADRIVDVVAYADHIECVFFPAILPHVRSKLRRLNGGGVFLRRPKRGRKLRPGERQGQVYVIVQPTPSALRYLARQRYLRLGSKTNQPSFSVYRVDIAIDFITETIADATSVGQFLTRRVLHKWHRDRRTNQSGETYYASRAGVPRNLAIYSDRPSKTGLGPCAHLELRFRTLARCRASKLDDLNQLAQGLNAFELLRREVRLAYIDQNAFDRFLEKTACGVKRAGGRYRETDLAEVVATLGRLFAPMIQNAENMPSPGSIEGVRAQDLYDAFKKSRSRFIAIEWEEFSDPPRWVANN
ncbi:hypothetical protein [Rhizobium phaseoli]|uniref:hypothetical protein n=1 Tax=Rhizobium phaseoli TaxID=396 RepID=UPI0012375A02|nr:hypothetical protein [Rhizobium phaseoli]